MAEIKNVDGAVLKEPEAADTNIALKEPERRTLIGRRQAPGPLAIGKNTWGVKRPFRLQTRRRATGGGPNPTPKRNPENRCAPQTRANRRAASGCADVDAGHTRA